MSGIKDRKKHHKSNCKLSICCLMACSDTSWGELQSVNTNPYECKCCSVSEATVWQQLLVSACCRLKLILYSDILMLCSYNSCLAWKDKAAVGVWKRHQKTWISWYTSVSEKHKMKCKVVLKKGERESWSLSWAVDDTHMTVSFVFVLFETECN